MNNSRGLAIINNQQICIQKVVIASFEITNSADRSCYLEETFLISDISQSVVLDMSFLKLDNPNVSLTICIMYWRKWNLEKALITTNQVNIIQLEIFI